jgi:hypothetical protein
VGERHHVPVTLPREKLGIPFTEDWVGFRTGLDGKKSLAPPPPGFDRWTFQPVAMLLNLTANKAIKTICRFFKIKDTEFRCYRVEK